MYYADEHPALPTMASMMSTAFVSMTAMGGVRDWVIVDPGVEKCELRSAHIQVPTKAASVEFLLMESAVVICQLVCRRGAAR